MPRNDGSTQPTVKVDSTLLPAAAHFNKEEEKDASVALPSLRSLTSKSDLDGYENWNKPQTLNYVHDIA